MFRLVWGGFAQQVVFVGVDGVDVSRRHRPLTNANRLANFLANCKRQNPSERLVQHRQHSAAPTRRRESEQSRPGEEILLRGMASAPLAGLLPELALHYKTNDQNPKLFIVITKRPSV